MRHEFSNMKTAKNDDTDGNRDANKNTNMHANKDVNSCSLHEES